MLRRYVAVLVTCAMLPPLAAAGTGAGAILKRDAWSYTKPDKSKKEYHVKAGTFFAFFAGMNWNQRKCRSGLCRVLFFDQNTNKSTEKTTWVEESDLEYFMFPCEANSSIDLAKAFGARDTQCLPIEGAATHQWTLTFVLSAKEKCKELGITPPEGSVFVQETPPPPAEAPR